MTDAYDGGGCLARHCSFVEAASMRDHHRRDHRRCEIIAIHPFQCTARTCRCRNSSATSSHVSLGISTASSSPVSRFSSTLLVTRKGGIVSAGCVWWVVLSNGGGGEGGGDLAGALFNTHKGRTSG